jgi:ubiquinone biosynthesis protein
VGLAALYRLLRAGVILTREGVVTLLAPPDPPSIGRLVLRIAKRVEKRDVGERSGAARLTTALDRLGPSYIKLGQFLATRPDIVGDLVASELSALQDSLPPFSLEQARKTIEHALEKPVDTLFEELSEPVAAASIAQVHRAIIPAPDTPEDADANADDDATPTRTVAVKVLRPEIEQRFARDLDAFYLVARLAERFVPKVRRLRPVAIVDILAKSVEMEMDLRMEASALSELAQNTTNDPGFRVPRVDWQRSARRVLTLDWVDGIKLSDIDALRAADVDLNGLADTLIQSFLRQALRDGLFHADMHQGNLFVDDKGDLVAVDLGITGRLSPKDRKFMAETLFGFITRDYHRVAVVHFEAGYVPAGQEVEQFAQALRAIGEPLHGSPANEISMARLLTQLFEVTELFHMQTQPQLLLLQKTMVVVEGVGRTLNPDLNIWQAAEPVVREWIERHLGPAGRISQAAQGAGALARLVADLPALAERSQQLSAEFGRLADTGLRLDERTVEAIGAAEARHNRSGRLALWIIAIAAVVAVLTLI